jgi:hypothetical protein
MDSYIDRIGLKTGQPLFTLQALSFWYQKMHASLTLSHKEDVAGSDGSGLGRSRRGGGVGSGGGAATIPARGSFMVTEI